MRIVRHAHTYNSVMKNGAKLAMLFVGTVIGAGFATGREILLFFRGLSPLSAATAGLLLGLLCTLFCFSGSAPIFPDLARNYPRLKEAFSAASHVAVALASVCTSAAMLAGSEELLFAMSGLHLFGLIFLAAALVFVLCGLEKIKLLNLAIIPVLALFVFFLFVKSGVCVIDGKISLTAPIAYSALNVFLSGRLLAASKATKNEAVWAGVFSGVMLAVLLFCLSILVLDFGDFSMPVYAAAVALGAPLAGGAIIAIAIFTTLLSSLKMSADEMLFFLKKLRPKMLSSGDDFNALFALLFAALLSSLVALFGFDKIVDVTYPAISVFGIGSLLLLGLRLFLNRLARAPVSPEHAITQRRVKTRLSKE